MITNIKLVMSIFAITIITGCGSESDDTQYEDSESNDQDNIIQTVKAGKVIGNLSHGVDMSDYYWVLSEGNQDTNISVTNKSGMNLILSEVNILNQVQQSTNRNLENEEGNEVETMKTSSPHGYEYSTFIKVTTAEGSGQYTLNIVMSPPEAELN